ncbi:FAD-dependent oxidoreductase [Seohaeicola saemankumensis]|uniref:FAD-dependent oxidoreductase n=1 Tax=Seohaeicola saemankumensis TaxID=481181 RepID=A0ABW3TDZ5_9RHOB
MIRREISGWGRYPREFCAVAQPRDPVAVPAVLSELTSAIPRGMGRSYGDSAINPDGVIDMRRLNRMLSFDPDTGILVAEAGATLADVIDACLPRGFFPMVTPGSKFVTLGGAIAADVHGKNHHVDGSFGDHVAWFDLLCPDGVERRCSLEANPDLFNLTLGGMGLTGIVLRAAIRLRRVETGYIRQRRVVASNLEAAMRAFEDYPDSTYSVAWIDCLARGAARGRSLVYLGEHARVSDLTGAQKADPLRPKRRALRQVPLDAPSCSLNRWTVRAFNAGYFRAGSRGPDHAVVDWDRYFYPLDALRDWNRIYGRKGFAQYQCALPPDSAADTLAEMLEAVSDAGQGSFLAVLKMFGAAAANRPMSFPRPGYTLALDFPISDAALRLMDRLDAMTRAAGGRLYLAKDSRMTPEMMHASYPEGVAALQACRAPQLQSTQSRRLRL